jgi:GDPmannose 4,6-dehydratase
MKKAFITGITGQDGYYLTKYLLENNYEIHGTIRRASTFNTTRIDSLISQYSTTNPINLYYSDLLDSASLYTLINKVMPDEVYNLAAQSHVAVSFKNPIYTTQVGNTGTISLLEAIKNTDKVDQASASEMFGGKDKIMLNEESPLVPKSPYAASKVFSYHMTQIYRDSYNLFCTNGILFNHESPMRGETFVTRKITRAVGRIVSGIQDKLILGNIEASRDWGFAGDYVEAMHKILNHKNPDDFVIATGETHTIKEFLKIAFNYVNLKYEDYIEISEKYYRPNEVGYLLGDPSKANKILGWKPKTSFDELVKMMLDNDIELAKSEKILIEKNLLKPSWENFLIP